MSFRSSIPATSSSSGGGENMYSLKWNHYPTYLTTGLAKLLEDIEFSMTDITLACEGQFIQAHKIALAVCSPFFKEYFKTYRMDKPGGLIVLANVKFRDLKNIIQFIYQGEVNVSNSDLNSFLRTAHDLKIEGLVDASANGSGTSSLNTTSDQKMENSKPNQSPLTGVTDQVATPRLPVSSCSHTSSNSSEQPPIKRSRVVGPSGHSSTSAIQTGASTSEPSIIPEIDRKQSAGPVQLPHVADYDPLEMEHDQEEEEMINLDDVKPEPISVYSLNDENDDEDSLGQHHGGGGHVSEAPRNESTGILYHNFDSSMSQPPGPGPSSTTASLQPGSKTASKQPENSSHSHWRPRVLDGKYFQILNLDHETEGVGVRASCVSCQRTIKGRLHPTSNFTTHMKNCHKDMFESYKLYKQSSRTNARAHKLQSSATQD